MAESADLLTQIQASLEQKDYTRTHQLLKKWHKLEPKNPWFHLYVARWYEATEKWEKAEEGYRKLLKVSDIPKIIAQSRQGLERLKRRVIEAEQQAIAAQKAAPDGEDYGVFILEPIAPEQRQGAAKHFATVMKTDPYSARLQLPTKAWRLFRTGTMGELRFQAIALAQGQITGFCLSLKQLHHIQVMQVKHIQALTPQLTLLCEDSAQQPVVLSFEWSEIDQYVAGLIPIFEESLEKDSRGKSYYKTKILDYAHFLDLHVGDRQMILRLNDQHYQFREGHSFFSEAQGKHQIEQFSVRQTWDNLRSTLGEYLTQATPPSDFKSFALHAADFPELLRKIDPQIHLFRQEQHRDTHWDPAWQLYSTVAFAKHRQDKMGAIAQDN